MRLVACCLALVLAAPLTAQQADTLADIRQDLSVLSVELQRLRTELSTTSGSDVGVSGSLLDRVNTIEAELRRVTDKAEELEFRIEQVVRDGTNRVGDLQFRLCELEPGCDISALGDTPPIGGVSPAQTGGAQAPVPAPVADAPAGGGELAVGEESDFRRAQEALANGDFQSAAELFATFRQTYPGGPLEPAALLGQGRALEGAGDMREAARAYLDAYSGYPSSDVAPEALWRLGSSLGALGSIEEACVTLAEVGVRYPGSDIVARAEASRGELGCS